jgi:hypothetical protein
MRSSYCVWAPGREGVSARGRGVVLSSFFVVLLVSDRVYDACHVLVGKILHQRLVQLRASAGLAGGGIALLASDLRIGLPVDLSPPWAAKTGMPPPILPIDALLAAIGWDQSFETEQGGSISVVCITPGLAAAVGRGSVWANDRLVFDAQTQAAFRRESGPEVGGLRSVT